MTNTTHRRATATLIATGLGAALLAAGSPGPATAATGELRYACAWNGGTEEMVARMSAEAPAEAFYSSASGPGGFTMTVATDAFVPAAIASDLWADGGRTVSGRITDLFTVTDGSDERGATMPVTSSWASVPLGDQAVPTSVGFRSETYPFGQVRSEPGYLSFRVREALELLLTVTKEGGATESLRIPCTRVTATGTWPEINRVAWVAPTATEVAVSEEVEFGEDLVVSPDVTPARGTATGTLTVSAGAAVSQVAIAGKAPVVALGGLTAGSHALSATFVPSDTRFYRGSTTAVPVVTVAKAAVEVRTRVLTRDAGKRTALRVRVRGAHGTVSTGQVRVTVRPVGGDGKQVKVRALGRSGSSVLRFAGLGPGRYRVAVSYRGDANHRRAVASRTFRVRPA